MELSSEMAAQSNTIRPHSLCFFMVGLSSGEVLAFRDARLKAGISPTSSDFELKLIRSVLKKALVAGRIPSNPAAAVDSLPGGRSSFVGHRRR